MTINHFFFTFYAMCVFESQTLEKIAGPVSDELDLFEKEYLDHLRSDADFLQPLLDHVGKGRGKRLRPLVFFLSQGLISRPNRKSTPIAVLLELLHTATLIHDDVVDGSAERRGRQSMNAIWGNRVSVLLGDYLMAKVLALGVAAPWEGILRIISTAVTDMGRGELRQILEDADKKISMDAYFQIIQGKTAGLFRAAAELGGLVVQAGVDQRNRLCRLGEAFGMAFQIRDDILDFAGHARHMGKPIGQDVSNGKMTLPLILAMEGISEEVKQGIVQRLSKDSKAEAEWIGRFVKEHQGIERAHEKARMFAKEAEEILATFNASVYRTAWGELVTHELERSG